MGITIVSRSGLPTKTTFGITKISKFIQQVIRRGAGIAFTSTNSTAGSFLRSIAPAGSILPLCFARQTIAIRFPIGIKDFHVRAVKGFLYLYPVHLGITLLLTQPITISYSIIPANINNWHLISPPTFIPGQLTVCSCAKSIIFGKRKLVFTNLKSTNRYHVRWLFIEASITKIVPHPERPCGHANHRRYRSYSGFISSTKVCSCGLKNRT